MGRWSRLLAAEVVAWIAPARGLRWLDVGCGTGAVSEAVLAVADPVSLIPGGRVTAYVWDYADGMQTLRRFWDAALHEDPAAASLDEGARFPICQPDSLEHCFADAGLRDLDARPVEVATIFRDFDDYWAPFLGGQGPAPTYCATLSQASRDRLRARLQATMPVEGDGTIRLRARAWAVQGVSS